MAEMIDGRALSAALRVQIKHEAELLFNEAAIVPSLSVILVGNDPASEVYVRNKEKQALEAGFESSIHRLDADTSQTELLAKVEKLNRDPSVHGILVQLPLPPHIDEHAVLHTINPDKDVDGFHAVNMGRLVSGQEGFVPCTPLGCIMLLKQQFKNLSGLHALVLGRSNIVGKPMAMLLLRENCTVTIAHSRTKDLAVLCNQADIIVAAVGKPRFVQGEWLKPGGVAIDVGINRISTQDGKTKLVGDIDFEAARAVVRAITPVPGGVGPMTIACLLYNTLKSACQSVTKPVPSLDFGGGGNN